MGNDFQSIERKDVTEMCRKLFVAAVMSEFQFRHIAAEKTLRFFKQIAICTVLSKVMMEISQAITYHIFRSCGEKVRSFGNEDLGKIVRFPYFSSFIANHVVENALSGSDFS